jgi:hypothetical protein
VFFAAPPASLQWVVRKSLQFLTALTMMAAALCSGNAAAPADSPLTTARPSLVSTVSVTDCGLVERSSFLGERLGVSSVHDDGFPAGTEVLLGQEPQPALPDAPVSCKRSAHASPQAERAPPRL